MQQSRRLPSQFNTSSGCPDPDLADRIVVAVKTGATEAEDKVPAILQTSLRCAPHVLVFSDLQQDLPGGYHLYDSLDSVTPSVKENTDFDFYRRQKEEWESHHNISAVKGQLSPGSSDELAAWRLDKYKNTHILEKTWAMKPEKDWYLLIDADTYVVWPSLLQWLKPLDPSVRGWYGSRIYLGETQFAHGGSGAAHSRATVYDFAVTHNGTANRWDSRIPDECCGDLALGKALQEHGNTIVDVEPAISGQSPATMPWLDEFWCTPTVTLHHVEPSTMHQLVALEDKFEYGQVSLSLSYPWIRRPFTHTNFGPLGLCHPLANILRTYIRRTTKNPVAERGLG